MTLVESAVRTLHLTFAAVWVGSVVFVTWAVLPPARDGRFGKADAVSFVFGRLAWVSRASAVVLLATGAHMAFALPAYGVEGLTGTGRGHLVLGMAGLWLVLTALVEVGVSRTRDGLREDFLREPARDNIRLFQAASVVAILLLVDAGAIAAGI